jgi:hypothetical protein
VLALVLGSCGKNGASGVGSCSETASTYKICVDFTDSAGTADEAKNACTNGGTTPDSKPGTYSSSA